MPLPNPCEHKADRCLNCSSHFYTVRPSLEEAVVTPAFRKGVPDHEDVLADILDCTRMHYHEMHKYERHVGGFTVFRAKRDRVHYVYAIAGSRLILLRAFGNYQEYRAYLEDDKRIIKDCAPYR